MKRVLVAAMVCISMGSRFVLAREFDAETGLVHMGARDYDPETGRFLQEDPHFHPGQNIYTYALDNPNKFSDPTGADVVLVQWNSGGFFHQEVWIGNPATGYIPIGYEPSSTLGGALSVGTGLTVGGYVLERPNTSMLPWAWPVIGGNIYGVIQQGPAADAQVLAYARALGQLPQWQRYNAYRNSCQDYAQNVFNYGLQQQKSH